MNLRLPSPALALALATAGLSLAYAHVSAVPPGAPAAPAQERTSLDQELARVQLEQELMLAERTARMLDELRTALEEWDREPTHESGAEGDAER